MIHVRRIVFAALVGATLLVTTPAGAESYDTTDDGLTVSLPEGGSTVQPGGSVTVSSSGWAINQPVTVELHSDPVVLGTVTASSVGTIAASFTIPAATPAGAHTIVVKGTDPSGAPRTVEEQITVGGSTTAAPSQLGFTGSSAVPLALAGGLLAAGGATVLRFRRRRLGVAA